MENVTFKLKHLTKLLSTLGLKDLSQLDLFIRDFNASLFDEESLEIYLLAIYMKYQMLQDGISQKINFQQKWIDSINHILELDENIFVKYLQVIPRLVSISVDATDEFNEFLRIFLFEEDITKRTKLLRVLTAILEIIDDDNKTLIFDSIPELRSVILQAITQIELIGVVSYSVIPSYLKLTSDNDIFSMICEYIKQEDSYLTLCCLSTDLINERTINEPWFWELIQRGFNTPENQRCALFLLKTTLQRIEDPPKLVFKNQSANAKYCWQNFVWLYESLDEKQSHLITPGFVMMESLENFITDWQVLIYKKLLYHESNVVQSFCLSNILNKQFNTCEDEHLYFAIESDILHILNNIYLFQDANISNQLRLFIKNLRKARLLPYFLTSSSKYEKWLAVPFFNIISCFLDEGFFELNDAVDVLQNFINISEKTLNTYIRNAIQCLLLNYATQIYSVDRLDEKKITQICYLMNKCHVQVDSFLWKKLIRWLESAQSAIELNNLPATFLFLLSDAKKLTDTELYHTFNIILDSFKDTSTRYNLDFKFYNKKVLFLNEFISLNLKNTVWDCIDVYKAPLFEYIQRSVKTCPELTIEIINAYLNVCRAFLNTNCTKWIYDCNEALNADSSNIVIKYFYLSVLEVLIEKDINPNDKFAICDIIKLLKSLRMEHYDNESRIFISSYYSVLNSITIHCINFTKTLNESYLRELSEKIFHSLEVGGRESLTKVMELVQVVLPNFLYSNICDIKRLMDLCWTETMELKKCDLFWPTINQFIKTFFKKELLENEEYTNSIVLYGNLILEQCESMRGLAKLFYDQLLRLNWQSEKLVDVLSTFIIRGFIFGPCVRKNERVELDTMKIIKNLEGIYVTKTVDNKYNLDFVVRVRAIEIALKMFSHHLPEGSGSIVHKDFLERLIAEYKKENKPRYFADSRLHHIKTRFMQALLVLQPYITTVDANEMLFDFLENVLINESPQPSVRYLMEWLFIILISKQHDFLTRITKNIEYYASKRISCLVSIISALYHLSNSNPIEFLTPTIMIVLPLTMSSNFNVRLYAQSTLFWLMKKDENRKDHRIIYDSLCRNLLQESASQPFQRISEDFFFTFFDPLKHLTVETIYCVIPKLTNLQNEEIDLTYFQGTSYKNIFNEENLYCQYHVQNAEEIIEENSIPETTNLYQKKIIPWKNIPINSKQKTTGELIVIASLIDRLPNLGGLTRTCEIFGVKNFIINNMKITEAKEFQSLSVSSEKWMKISEVKADQLAAFILQLKKESYTIVGCEQSTQSVALHQYTFPEKSALLLGNEKEGIYPHLLALLDVCIEIPQAGVIRSLNVHVSGALTIWQYACQHLFNK